MRMWSRLKLVLLTATPTAILCVLWYLTRNNKKKLQGTPDSHDLPKIEVTDADTSHDESNLAAEMQMEYNVQSNSSMIETCARKSELTCMKEEPSYEENDNQSSVENMTDIQSSVNAINKSSVIYHETPTYEDNIEPAPFCDIVDEYVLSDNNSPHTVLIHSDAFGDNLSENKMKFICDVAVEDVIENDGLKSMVSAQTVKRDETDSFSINQKSDVSTAGHVSAFDTDHSELLSDAISEKELDISESVKTSTVPPEEQIQALYTVDGPNCHSEAGSLSMDVANEQEDDKSRDQALHPEMDSVVYQFDFPSELCGRLIGRQGHNVSMIRQNSGADIFVKNKIFTTTDRVVILQGTESQVSSALNLIQTKFPEKRYPNVSYLPSVPEDMLASQSLMASQSIMQLSLPLNVTLEVIVSRVVSANHVFVQQPTHPTYLQLERQMYEMKQFYGADVNIPDLPRPFEIGVVCVALIDGNWYRVQIINVSSEDTDECDVKFVDYGGYQRVHGSLLKQIRQQFVTLPFQAIECYLYGVISPNDDGEFPPEAASVLIELVSGSILQAEVVAIEEDQVPYIQLTKIAGVQTKVINRELVHRGVARWLEV